jgi:TIR domain
LTSGGDVWDTSEVRPSRVFLSYAGNDHATADRFRQDLSERDIVAFIFPPGGNLVLDINRALAQSDYFVLLWSQAAADRQWVDAEWSAAFARELQERRSFLFIVRLDRTPLPVLLAARHYFDAVDSNWNDLVDELVALWLRDRAVGEPVLPAPCSATAENGGGERRKNIVLYVRNRALSVAHVIVVPEESTGRQLESLVRATLALPDVEEKFGGAVGMRFGYQLKNAGERISADRKLAESHIVDGDTIDLEVQVESFGPGGSSPAVTYRHGVSASLSPAATRSLINSAFGHLIPW